MEGWHLARRDMPGFRESVVKGPHGDVVQLEVSSWVQVPYVLQRLHCAPMRVVFVDDSNPQQAGIRDFLRISNSTNIKEILEKLKGHLDAAESFKPHELPPPGSITCAADWMCAHDFSQIVGRRLATTEVLRVPETEERLDAEFRSAAVAAFSSGRPVIVTLPVGMQAQAVAAVLRDACSYVADSDALKSRVKVWMPDSVSSYTQAWNAELSLQQFFETTAGSSQTPHEPIPAMREELPEPTQEPTEDGSERAPSPSERLKDAYEDALVLSLTSEGFGGEQPEVSDTLDQQLPVGGVLGTQSEGVSLTEDSPSLDTSKPSECAPNALAVKNLNETQNYVSRALDILLDPPKEFADEVTFRIEHLEGFFTYKLEPYARSPVTDETTVIRESKGAVEPAVVSPGPAARILDRCRMRSFDDTAQMLFEAHEHLCAKFSEEHRPGNSVQDGHLVTLPNHGKAIFVSDLEGDVAKLALLIDQYDLIDAWRRDEPIFLCVLGDMVDRSTTGSLLVEFLLELKVREGFSRQVIILPGNHELSLEMNFQKTKNYRSDEPSLLGDISEGSIPVEPTRRVGKTLSRCFMNFALTRR